MQLPPPVMEQAPVQNGPENTSEKLAESGPAARPERHSGIQSQGMPMPTIPLPQQPSVTQQQSQTDVISTTNSSMPAIASDSDLIEKEWVNKAKQIVELTRDDPYRQSQQLTGVKVDYMQKRYGKSIKMGK